MHINSILKLKLKKYIAAAMLIVIFAISLSGCGNVGEKNNNTSSKGEGNDKTSSGQDSEQNNEEALFLNPFTGEPVKSKDELLNRPLAVMVNNIKVSLPQKGISQADVIFEMPVEGGITRLMAVFSDYTKMPDIGSIRSARHDYVELAVPFNPIYLHFGGSEPGKEAIKKNNIDDIDGLTMANSAFYQDKNRLNSMSSEHTWFSNLDKLKNGIEKKSFETKLTEPLSPMFDFVKPNESAMELYSADTTLSGAVDASIKFSSGVIAGFKYDSTTGLYNKSQYGKPHIDATTNKAVAVKNVLVMYTNIGDTPNGKNKEIDLSKGTGYYLSEGKKIDVTFEKSSVKSPLVVKDLSGKALKMNAGKTWVCIAPTETKKSAVITAE